VRGNGRREARMAVAKMPQRRRRSTACARSKSKCRVRGRAVSQRCVRCRRQASRLLQFVTLQRFRITVVGRESVVVCDFFRADLRSARMLPPSFARCGGWGAEVRKGRATEKVKT